MFSSHKGNIIYLLGLAALFYVGIFFMPQISIPLWPFPGSLLKFVAAILIFINSFIIYFYLSDNEQSEQRNKSALIVSALYILSPIHLDVFIFDFQSLALFSETALLLFIYLYQKRKIEYALGFILLAVLFNSKLIFIMFALLFDKKIQMLGKLFLISTLSVIGIYSVPFFYQMNGEISLARILFYLEKFFFPFQYLFLDDSQIIPDFYSWLGIIGLFLCFFAILNRLKIRWVSLFISGGLLSFYWPSFHLESFRVPTVYFLGSLYSVILIGLILIIFNLTNGRFKRLFYPVSLFLAILWGGSLLSFQYKAISLEAIWQEALARLPLESKLEEPLKYEYANILILNNKKKEANLFINQNRKNNFQKNSWDLLLMQTKE